MGDRGHAGARVGGVGAGMGSKGHAGPDLGTWGVQG